MCAHALSLSCSVYSVSAYIQAQLLSMLLIQTRCNSTNDDNLYLPLHAIALQLLLLTSCRITQLQCVATLSHIVACITALYDTDVVPGNDQSDSAGRAEDLYT
jgi:hypothetical protein